MEGNDFSLLPTKVATAAQPSSTIEFFKAASQFAELLEKEKVYWNRTKCILLGKEAAGKTSILKYLTNSKHDDNVSTDGIDIKDIEITSLSGKLVKSSLLQSTNSKSSSFRGVDARSIGDEEEKHFFRFCDFGGQAVFCKQSFLSFPFNLLTTTIKKDPTHQFFLSGRCIYIVVFDGQEIDFGPRVYYWLNTISTFTFPNFLNYFVHSDLSQEQ